MCQRDNNSTKDLKTAEGHQWVINTTMFTFKLAFKMDAMLTPTVLTRTFFFTRYPYLSVYKYRISDTIDCIFRCKSNGVNSSFIVSVLYISFCGDNTLAISEIPGIHGFCPIVL